MTTLHTVRLTDHQKEVLVKIYTSATPELARAETEFDEKNIVAAEILMDLDAISEDETGIQVTQAGIELMRQQGLLDDSDNLTQEAEQYKTSDNINTQPDMGDDMFGDDMGLDEFDPELPDEEQPDDIDSDLASLDELPKTESLFVSVHNSLNESCSKMKKKKSIKKQQSARRRQFKKS